MNKPRIEFKIYPSLLDKFQEFLDYEQAAEEPWNKVSETAKEKGQYPDLEVGDYILSPDEMADKLEQELIDTINRVPHEPWEAADKGTCFNEIVDMIIADRECEYEGMEVETGETNITARLHGFEFTYDRTFCEEVAQGLAGSVSQLFTKSTIDTKYGTVELYGYIDEYLLNQVIDLKTTSQYDFLKFERKWQRHIYPYCLVENGNEVEGFEYRVIKWKGGTKFQPALSGEIIPEYYTYTHSESTDALRAMLEQFIGWLESRKDRITDTKIFAADEQAEQVEECVEQATQDNVPVGDETKLIERLKRVFEWDLKQTIQEFDKKYTDGYPCDDPQSWLSVLKDNPEAAEMATKMNARLCDIEALEEAIQTKRKKP